jgi:hypothetical protein
MIVLCSQPTWSANQSSNSVPLGRDSRSALSRTAGSDPPRDHRPSRRWTRRCPRRSKLSTERCMVRTLTPILTASYRSFLIPNDSEVLPAGKPRYAPSPRVTYKSRSTSPLPLASGDMN